MTGISRIFLMILGYSNCHNQILTLQEALLGAGAIGKIRHNPRTSLVVQGAKTLCSQSRGPVVQSLVRNWIPHAATNDSACHNED